MRVFLLSLLLIGCHRDLDVPECAKSEQGCTDAAADEGTIADSQIADSGVDSGSVDSAIDAVDACECAPGVVEPVTGSCPGALEKKTKTCATSCKWGAETCALPKGWTAIANAPIEGRVQASAVWTGGELIVYGGGKYLDGGEGRNDGAIYSLGKNTWTALPIPTQTTAARKRHGAVWAGTTTMLVWGGMHGSVLRDDGLEYDAFAKTWSALPAAPLSARQYFSTVWIPTAGKMFIWGGDDLTNPLSDGALYSATMRTWTKLPAAPIAARIGAAAIWTGTKVLVWGGRGVGGAGLTDGALYDPSTNTWSTIPSAPIKGRFLAGHGSATSGFVVHNGSNPPETYWDGALLKMTPSLAWSALTPPPSTMPVRQFPQTWVIGDELFVWSGMVESSGTLSTESSGGALDLKSGVWSALPSKDAPSARAAATTVTTATAAIVWSGYEIPGGIPELATSGALYVP